MGRLRAAAVVALAAFAAAAGLFAIATFELVATKSAQRDQLARMTSSFVSVYAELRPPGSSIPAIFRRRGVEHFSAGAQAADDMNADVRVPGLPGRELRTAARDPRIGDVIAAMAASPAPTPIEELRVENGRLIGRTVSPSIANAQNCVSCHNDLLGAEYYQLGDVMGALVVENDLTERTGKHLAYSVLAFFGALIGFSLLIGRERRRMRAKVDALTTRVKLEREKAEVEAQAHFLSSHDSLTGLANRSMFLKRLETDLKAGAPVLAAIIDLDDFKSVNDTMGHDAGDALLAAVGDRLERLTARHCGQAARLGGDEFALLVPSAGAMDADALGAAIVAVIRPQVDHHGLRISPSCSVGVADSDAVSGDVTAGRVMKAADTALYAAKQDGKNRSRSFDHELRADMGRRSDLAAALPSALAEGRIRAAFQPKVDLLSGRLVGFETLGRWLHGGEDVPPSLFVPLAEERGLVSELDLLVLSRALAFSSRLERALGAPVPVSSNLSAISLQRPSVTEEVLEQLTRAKLAPSRLTLEITESTLVRNCEHAARALAPLRARGVRVSLDDFGTGYSSLSYLRRLPFDELKIDRSFVQDLDQDQTGQALFLNIVELARALDKDVVVEGIETARQLSLVRAHGGRVGQGFQIAQPLDETGAEVFASHALAAGALSA